MPPRPFPLHVNIGTDIQHVPRIRSLLTKVEPAQRTVQLRRFMRKFLTSLEQESFWARFRTLDLVPDKLTAHDSAQSRTQVWDDISKHLSGRWAAKEAVIKAFTWRKLSPLNILILKAQEGGFQTPLYALVTDCPCSSHGASDTLTGAEAGSISSLPVEENALEDSGYIPSSEQHVGMDGQIAKISISHDGDYATAVCLAAEEPMQNDVGGEMRAREPY